MIAADRMSQFFHQESAFDQAGDYHPENDEDMEDFSQEIGGESPMPAPTTSQMAGGGSVGGKKSSMKAMLIAIGAGALIGGLVGYIVYSKVSK